MPETEVWTIGRLLQWTTDYLKQHGSESPRLDAEVLLATAAGCQRIELYTRFTDVAGDALRAAFRQLVKRRAEGTPVAYLVGRREFYSLSFRITPDVLVPRPETELLVVSLLDLLKEQAATGQGTGPLVADVGTGSGIIAICAALFASCPVAAIDASPAALAVAGQNAAAHGVAERIEFFESDLFAGVPVERKFDAVASNPPYVATAELAALPRDVKHFEPLSALDGGPQGTAVIERLIPQAAERLLPGGWLLLEISPSILDRVVALVAADGRFEPASVIKDLAGHARVVKAKSYRSPR